jgi:hypothetical protein
MGLGARENKWMSGRAGARMSGDIQKPARACTWGGWQGRWTQDWAEGGDGNACPPFRMVCVGLCMQRYHGHPSKRVSKVLIPGQTQVRDQMSRYVQLLRLAASCTPSENVRDLEVEVLLYGVPPFLQPPSFGHQRPAACWHILVREEEQRAVRADRCTATPDMHTHDTVWGLHGRGHSSSAALGSARGGRSREQLFALVLAELSRPGRAALGRSRHAPHAGGRSVRAF